MRVEMWFHCLDVMEVEISLDGDPTIVDELMKLIRDTMLKKKHWEEG